jgi:hypothetical protein
MNHCSVLEDMDANGCWLWTTFQEHEARVHLSPSQWDSKRHNGILTLRLS